MERKDFAVKKVQNLNLRDEAARVTLRTLRQQGHVYVELRKISKRSIFFCTLCLTQCFSESVLFDHLRGNLHSRRYNAAKITLLLSNPWPFNDGVLFFDISRETDQDGGSGDLANVNEVTSMFRGTTDQDFTELASNRISNGKNAGKTVIGHEKVKKCKGVQEHFSISYVLPNDEISKYELKIIGYGHIGAKICEDSENSSIFSRIWCAWLGDGNSDGCDELLTSPKCDSAIVSFSYTYTLGKKSATQDENKPASPSFFFEIDESGRRIKKRKKSFSDPEDSSEVFADRDLRQKLRKKNPFISGRSCDICGQPLLLGKDVATLLNLKTERFLCSSRNINGAFHLFHVSCLIHWVLLCEFELWTNQPMNPKGTRGRKGKAPVNNNLISSILCPECLGTGIHIEGDAIEKTTVSLSAAFRYKSKAVSGQKAWMKSPENLQKCSTGLCFPSNCTEKLQEKVSPTKLLLFYRAGE